ncbi:hydroxyacid dehydrogenase [Candidatus Jorgensenbacteria bacterium CG_4_10_14_0_8_um_filter_39_13]|uniref:Hydroxyacid dehydrogenase n=2 Tax=Candidatus Joergenseniibacteriota TaxID=1752739 RepID=A0A2M7RHN3_9BACT|nr:MAG: hydroxyacid dehydrogenase [Candidatus Jorgensenbacteria bacterium CG03_land_8_20_14_0_80_38_39]PIY96260.1 MAG: hydroxyacid dehydrogenase [Candidatus Jorgensenbacteria bacterium CG_4_10_14_0_8_um_filter_39_13]PJA95195.1 MAG: hydroxyacid dehydrogenase [Candidatus Jorgensenbacteria bacterium CG_4_9_14_3_um_filter_38_10]
MKIAFFEIKDYEKKYFESALKAHELLFFDFPLNEETVDSAKDADIVSVFVFSQVNDKVVSKLAKTKSIATRSTGYDHIDLEACRQKGILVSNIPTYGVETVAEHTLSLMLAISRRIFESLEKTRKGDFSNDDITGFQLKDKTLGIIGCGKIGKRVAELAKIFGMKVLAYDVFKDEGAAKKIGYQYVDFETLLKEADFITLHANLTKENYHLLNKAAFQKMKEGVVIINTARGSLIDLQAFVEYLKLGKIKAAGIDVLEEESEEKEEIKLLYENKLNKEQLQKLLADHILTEFEDQNKNVIITPHNAFNSREALAEILETAAKNILGFVNDNPINIVK